MFLVDVQVRWNPLAHPNIVRWLSEPQSDEEKLLEKGLDDSTRREVATAQGGVEGD